uniref:Galectin n=1 Tax=Terrapene triunguis TaxID=2587831 RepID=A0A674JIY5_9SAUR
MLAHSELVSDRSVAVWSSQLPDCNSHPLLHRQGGSQSRVLAARGGGELSTQAHKSGFPHPKALQPLLVIPDLHDNVIPPLSACFPNFQCGSCPSPDVAFHFNPRFEEGGCVVCNTQERQNWGREERKDEMPFLKGHPFEIRVLHFVEYKHRIPLSKVNYLSVSGGVDVAIISFQDTAVSADCMYYCVSEPRGELEKL